MNTIPLHAELTIFAFLDVYTLRGINRKANQISKARMDKAAIVIRRTLQRHLLMEREFMISGMDLVDLSLNPHTDFIGLDPRLERLIRFKFKRFYPMKYRISVMKGSIHYVLRDFDMQAQVVALILQTDRPLNDRYNDWVDLLPPYLLEYNGW